MKLKVHNKGKSTKTKVRIRKQKYQRQKNAIFLKKALWFQELLFLLSYWHYSLPWPKCKHQDPGEKQEKSDEFLDLDCQFG